MNENGYDYNSIDNSNSSAAGEPQNYGAVYSPGTNGEYSYKPYSNTAPGYSAAQEGTAAGAVNQKKKKSHGGAIIGITAAVLAIIMVFLAACTGLIFLSSRIIGSMRNNSGSGSETTGSGNEITSSSIGAVQISDRNEPDVDTVSVKAGEAMTIAQVVAKVKDSVVEITTETVTGGSGIYSQYVVSGAGSGVVISEAGLIITNNHVIDGATKITVRLTDGTEFTATVIGADADNDIAVISVTPGEKKLTAATLGKSDLLVTGEEIVVIGNPLGELGGTVTNGIISATEREVVIDSSGTMTLLQTNAAVNPGNSGGGMFNLYGELVGIVNAKSSGDNIEGIGFAIPINTAWTVAQELIQYGYVKGRATVGISVLDVTSVLYARYYFNSNQLGVYITSAEKDLGFEFGDRIISFNGTEISQSSDISSLLKKSNVGDKVTIVVMRKGQTVSVDVTLIEKVPESK